MDEFHQIGSNDFVWNSEKAAMNRQVHGVRFEDAATVFLDPLFTLVDASRNEEARFAAIGFDQGARLLFVVHLQMDGEFIRLISARRAEANEEQIYVE